MGFRFSIKLWLLSPLMIGALALMLAAAPGAARTEMSDAAHIVFNDGSLILDYDWWDDDELALYAVNPHGAIVWLHTITTGDRKKLISATDLSRVLGRDADWEKLTFSLSPHRRYITFYVPPAGPLEAPFFKVVDMESPRIRAFSFSKTPADFTVGKSVWDNTDKYVYVSAQEFSAPENVVSLGRLSLETGAFLPLALKEQVDLIDDMAYDPQSNSILMAARSFGGEYPRGNFLVKYSLSENTISCIHEAYQYRGIEITDTGEVLVGAVVKEAFGGSFPGFLMVDETFELPETPDEGKAARYASRILLIRPDDEPEVLLTSQDRGFDFEPSLSPDGNHLAFLRMFYRLPYAVRVRAPANDAFLCVKERHGAQEWVVMQGAESFIFCPASRLLAVRYRDRSFLTLFELPK